MYLILFDIDGTLIDSGEAGTRSLNLAFQELFSIKNAFYGISMAGKTDTQIMKEGLGKHGVSTVGNLEVLISTYLKYLQSEIHNDRKHIKPGIYELLERLSFIKDTHIGLLTGNLEPGARIKLEPFNLNKYFPAGAFGSDDEDRNRLLPIAVKRFEELCRTRIDYASCIVIGDTPRDVYCAKPYGALCIGVATGSYSFNELRHAGADYIFENLSDHPDVYDILCKIPFD
ncbi:MAG: hydrolase [Nitrospira sp.]|nr:hydrolase [Nitrospira sp.]